MVMTDCGPVMPLPSRDVFAKHYPNYVFTNHYWAAADLYQVATCQYPKGDRLVEGLNHYWRYFCFLKIPRFKTALSDQKGTECVGEYEHPGSSSLKLQS